MEKFRSKSVITSSVQRNRTRFRFSGLLFLKLSIDDKCRVIGIASRLSLIDRSYSRWDDFNHLWQLFIVTSILFLLWIVLRRFFQQYIEHVLRYLWWKNEVTTKVVKEERSRIRSSSTILIGIQRNNPFYAQIGELRMRREEKFEEASVFLPYLHRQCYEKLRLFYPYKHVRLNSMRVRTRKWAIQRARAVQREHRTQEMWSVSLTVDSRDNQNNGRYRIV